MHVNIVLNQTSGMYTLGCINLTTLESIPNLNLDSGNLSILTASVWMVGDGLNHYLTQLERCISPLAWVSYPQISSDHISCILATPTYSV